MFCYTRRWATIVGPALRSAQSRIRPEGASAPSSGARSMSAFVIIGGQWGDEGKGRTVDLYAQEASIVAR